MPVLTRSKTKKLKRIIKNLINTFGYATINLAKDRNHQINVIVPFADTFAHGPHNTYCVESYHNNCYRNHTEKMKKIIGWHKLKYDHTLFAYVIAFAEYYFCGVRFPRSWWPETHWRRDWDIGKKSIIPESIEEAIEAHKKMFKYLNYCEHPTFDDRFCRDGWTTWVHQDEPHIVPGRYKDMIDWCRDIY